MFNVFYYNSAPQSQLPTIHARFTCICIRNIRITLNIFAPQVAVDIVGGASSWCLLVNFRTGHCETATILTVRRPTNCQQDVWRLCLARMDNYFPYALGSQHALNISESSSIYLHMSTQPYTYIMRSTIQRRPYVVHTSGNGNLLHLHEKGFHGGNARPNKKGSFRRRARFFRWSPKVYTDFRTRKRISDKRLRWRLIEAATSCAKAICSLKVSPTSRKRTIQYVCVCVSSSLRWDAGPPKTQHIQGFSPIEYKLLSVRNETYTHTHTLLGFAVFSYLSSIIVCLYLTYTSESIDGRRSESDVSFAQTHTSVHQPAANTLIFCQWTYKEFQMNNKTSTHFI